MSILAKQQETKLVFEISDQCRLELELSCLNAKYRKIIQRTPAVLNHISGEFGITFLVNEKYAVKVVPLSIFDKVETSFKREFLELLECNRVKLNWWRQKWKQFQAQRKLNVENRTSHTRFEKECDLMKKMSKHGIAPQVFTTQICPQALHSERFDTILGYHQPIDVGVIFTERLSCTLYDWVRQMRSSTLPLTIFVKQAKIVLRQLVRLAEKLKKLGLFHHDAHYSNIMIKTRKPDSLLVSRVYLIDFDATYVTNSASQSQGVPVFFTIPQLFPEYPLQLFMKQHYHFFFRVLQPGSLL